MEKAYIILVHKNPRQLLQLITRLDDGNAAFFIHIDKKANLQSFQPVLNYSNCVYLVQQELTNWGGMGLVKATINAMEAVDSHKKYKRITLLSGQDYPVKSNGFINHFFKSAKDSIFIDYTAIPDYDRWHTTGGMYRVNKYFFGLKAYQRYIAKAMNFSARFIPSFQRKMPDSLKPYAGSQWWSIDSYALSYILNYIKENPAYTAFHKYTFAPDEFYFQTILLNSKDEKIINGIVNNNLMYTRWLHSSSSHPEIITKSSVDELVASGSLFARKFEQETDNEVFDLIDESCDQLDNYVAHERR